MPHRFMSLAAFAVAIPAVAGATVAPSAKAAPTADKQLTKAEFAKGIDTRFAQMDTNHDGFLSKDEVAAMQTKALQAATAEQNKRLEAEFKKLDTDKNGSLSLAEFKAAARPFRASETPAQMLAKLDANKDGKISAAEYRNPPMTNFDRMDTNHDGVVTAAELKAAREKH